MEQTRILHTLILSMK